MVTYFDIGFRKGDGIQVVTPKWTRDVDLRIHFVTLLQDQIGFGLLWVEITAFDQLCRDVKRV